MDYRKIINVLAESAATGRVAQIHLQDIEDAGLTILPTMVRLGHGNNDNDVMVNAAKGNIDHWSLIIAVNYKLQD